MDQSHNITQSFLIVEIDQYPANISLLSVTQTHLILKLLLLLERLPHKRHQHNSYTQHGGTAHTKPQQELVLL
jgi:hypothetical protein